MDLDLDQLLADRPPWDLTLTIDGAAHRVRDLSGHEMQRLERARAAKDAAAVAAFVQGCFEAPGPDVSRWTPEEFVAVLAAVRCYWQGRLVEVGDVVCKALVEAVLAGLRPAGDAERDGD
jgi:hypothetical protein